jgi:hypothetical protein
MNFLPRCLFAILLIFTVMAQLARLQNGLEPDRATDLSGGLARLGGEMLTTKPSGGVTAVVSGCPMPVTLVQVGFNGSDNVSLDELIATDTVARYAYLGFVGDRLDFTAIAGRWAAASTLNVFGLRHAKAPAVVVVALLPKACPRLAELDWSVLSPWS